MCVCKVVRVNTNKMSYWDKPVIIVSAKCDLCGKTCDPVGDRVGLNTHLHQRCRAPTRAIAVYAPAVYAPAVYAPAVYAPAVYAPEYGSNTTWVITKEKKKKTGDSVVWLSK